MGISEESSSCCGTAHSIDKKFCIDVLLVVVVVNITVGLIALSQYMGEDGKWSDEPIRRRKILACACLLFLSATALCWFIMRKEVIHRREERLYLIQQDKPPSYESCLSSESAAPPPSYCSVARPVHIV